MTITTLTNPTQGAAQIRIFICADCGLQENQPSDAIPLGWDLLAMDCGGAPFVRCPDCCERIEQAHFDRMADFLGPTGSARPTASRLSAIFEATAPTPAPFSIFLEKQDSGDYRVAVLPEAVLMRWLPLGFFLTPAEARATARNLIHYAAQAEMPGKLVERKGAPA